MRRRLRTLLARLGLDSDVWPVALLLFAVVIPAVCLLWFMGEAMRNERLAIRQKLADLYHPQLAEAQAGLEAHWEKAALDLQALAQTNRPSAAFAACLRYGGGTLESILIFDEQGRLAYPDNPSGFGIELPETESKWAYASQLEYLGKDLLAAAGRYAALAKATTNINFTARALQAEARCLVQAGQTDAAIRLVETTLSNDKFAEATDSQGRLIAANAELMVLDLLTNRGSASFMGAAESLRRRLMNYRNPALAASQRRFLMRETERLAPRKFQFVTFKAEELAARMQETHPMAAGDATIRRAPFPDLWQFATPDHRVLALVRTERLRASVRAGPVASPMAEDASITLLPPGIEDDAALLSLPAGKMLPGWRLALSLKDQSLYDSRTEQRKSVYFWTAMLVVATMGVLTLLALRLLRRQMALARLKNDLAATVSHELRTPLSSMRVLVDTLLDREQIDESAREYLILIARENERLSGLIQNFLAFSRMERNRHAFRIAPMSALGAIDAAVAAMGERFNEPGCRFELEVEPALPGVLADHDALITALVNLLDNAHKYSEDIKHIILRAWSSEGEVFFSVKDNGIGIAPRELKRIFQHFYQVDQRLSRKSSGCGLGLSIVRFIVKAHHGNVCVDSRPGGGSTFTISFPAVPAADAVNQEAIA